MFLILYTMYVMENKNSQNKKIQCKTKLDSLAPIAAVRVICRLKIVTSTDSTANIANRTPSAANVHL